MVLYSPKQKKGVHLGGFEVTTWGAANPQHPLLPPKTIPYRKSLLLWMILSFSREEIKLSLNI